MNQPVLNDQKDDLEKRPEDVAPWQAQQRPLQYRVAQAGQGICGFLVDVGLAAGDK